MLLLRSTTIHPAVAPNRVNSSIKPTHLSVLHHLQEAGSRAVASPATAVGTAWCRAPPRGLWRSQRGLSLLEATCCSRGTGCLVVLGSASSWYGSMSGCDGQSSWLRRACPGRAAGAVARLQLDIEANALISCRIHRVCDVRTAERLRRPSCTWTQQHVQAFCRPQSDRPCASPTARRAGAPG